MESRHSSGMKYNNSIPLVAEKNERKKEIA